MSFNRGCSQAMSLSRRCLIQCIEKHSGIFCIFVGFLRTAIIGLFTGLYSGTVSAVKCGGGVSNFFPGNAGVRQGCVFASSLFITCINWVLGRAVDQSHCGASVSKSEITDLIVVDDAVIFVESLEVLIMALEALHGEAKSLGLTVFWTKTKVKVF